MIGDFQSRRETVKTNIFNENPFTEFDCNNTLTLSQTTNFKLEEFANDNFNINENGIKFCQQVENTVGKEEIARYEQFLLFPQCFQKTCIADT